MTHRHRPQVAKPTGWANSFLARLTALVIAVVAALATVVGVGQLHDTQVAATLSSRVAYTYDGAPHLSLRANESSGVAAPTRSAVHNSAVTAGDEPRPVAGTGFAAETVVETERTAAVALKPGEATARWDEFLGEGPTTNIHPRTGLPDANRIVSSDGTRSIRFGPHEMGSSPTKFHYHEETWSFDGASNTWFVDNIMVRVPFPKGAW